MGVELRPLGVKCNIQCQYCYQDPQRDAGNVNHRYDLARMKQALLDYGEPFTLFGGEPLLVPFEDLVSLFEFGLEKFGQNSIQTNGSLITDKHIELFIRCKVHVGISLDGPGDLNDVRWAGNQRMTREATQVSEEAIVKLCQAGAPPSLIITLHRANATGNRLQRMKDWFHYLDGIGVTSVRLHILEVDNNAVGQKYALTTEENIEAFRFFNAAEKDLEHIKFDLFTEMRKLLMGNDQNTTCVWNACDPLTTRAVQGIEGNGQRSNCGRTNKDGIDFTKSDVPGFERSMALYYTPFENNGCANCRFFLMCKGQCPGTAIDSDWRNRSQDCVVWYKLFEEAERQLIEEGQTPLSISDKRTEVEQAMLSQWAVGNNQSIFQISNNTSVQSPEGMTGHGDAHGDHSDAAL